MLCPGETENQKYLYPAAVGCRYFKYSGYFNRKARKPMKNVREIPFNAIPNVKIGHAQDSENGTGCTVLIFKDKAPCGLDVRGGGPASRETQLLNPTASNDGVHAVLLSGGSAYGLDAAGGVMKYLEERGIGFPVGDVVVPIVVGSCIFDLGCGSPRVRPDAEMGYAACVNSEKNENPQGNVGAGMGATVGKLLGPGRTMKSGLGTYGVQLGDLQVGAVVAVNAIGDVYALDSQKELAGLLSEDGSSMISSEEAALALMQQAAGFVSNTTIAAIVTNATLSKSQMKKVAQLSSNGMARTIRPVNTSMDGDTVYALSCGTVSASGDVVGTLGAYALGMAINRAVTEAEDRFGYPSAKHFL